MVGRNKAVSGIYRQRHQAERALDLLIARGIPCSSISVVLLAPADAAVRDGGMDGGVLAGTIGILAGVGAVAVRGEDRHRRHPAVALSYGAGLALIVDEFALLLDLKDVYWARQGRISVDLGVGGSSLAGTYFAALPLLRALRRRGK